MDGGLVERARAGDADAFDELARSRIDSVYRTALAILGSPADARDAAQETLVTLDVAINGQSVGTSRPGSISQFDPSSRPEPWVVTLTTDSGDAVSGITYSRSDIGLDAGGTNSDPGRGVGRRDDLFCGRLDVYAGFAPVGGTFMPSSDQGPCVEGSSSPLATPRSSVTTTPDGAFDARDYGPAPWTISARNTSGREITSQVLSPQDIWSTTADYPIEDAAWLARRDLSCGRFEMWAGSPASGPAPFGSYPPGDCDP